MAATLLGVPFDHNSSFLRGAAEAPAALRKAFRCESSSLWSERGIDLSGVADAGDAPSWEAITETVAAIDSPLCLGGDHSVTWPILRGIRPRHPTLTVLQIDAHPDLYPEFGGSRESHACPFARVMEETLCDRLVQVGIRTTNDIQRAQAARFGVEWIEMKDFGRPLEITGPTYVTIDLDGLDPAFAPGVSHPEPGGLSTRQVIDLLHSLDGPVIGADVVEYNPRRDLNDLTAFVGARLMKELAGAMSG